jgi:hypothetical protein
MATNKDEALALEHVTERLRARLPHIDPVTLDRHVDTAYHELDGAPIRDYIEILVERAVLETVERRVA